MTMNTGCGCFRPPQQRWLDPRLRWQQPGLRRLLSTDDSFTRALSHFTGSPVVVELLSDEQSTRLFSTAVARREVLLKSGAVTVRASSALSGQPTIALKRAFAGLSDTPLVQLLEQQTDCVRPLLAVIGHGGCWYRSSYYHIGRGQLHIIECLAENKSQINQNSCSEGCRRAIAGFPVLFW